MGKTKGEKTASPAEGKIKAVPGAVREASGKKQKNPFGDSLAAVESKHKFGDKGGGSSDKYTEKGPGEPKAKQPAKKKKKKPAEKTKKAGNKVGVDIDEHEAKASSSSDGEDWDFPTSACPFSEEVRRDNE